MEWLGLWTGPFFFCKRYFGEGRPAMEIKMGFGALNDDDFIASFEKCTLAAGAFRHADHIRLAWLYVTRHGAAQAEARLLSGIKKMADHARATEKFRYTTTVAWARLVAGTLQPGGAQEQVFEKWIAQHPQLLDSKLLQNYYSMEKLGCPDARCAWVEPDLAPLLL
jgi:hypothetical protein